MLLPVAVAVGLVVRSLPILKKHSLWALLLSSKWQPSEGHFGFYPFILGTVWVTALAMLLAVPPCLLSAVFLSEYASRRVREWVKPVLDLLAAIPSVVYGLWGVLVIVPVVAEVAPWMDEHLRFLPWLRIQDFTTGYCILTGAVVLAVMVAPFIVAVSNEVLRTFPDGAREAALAVGATRWQVVKKVVLRRTLPGLVAAIVLGFSRAFGETMAVLMVVGNVAKAPHSVFDAGYPLPALIANNYGEMMSIPLYDSALLLAALMLFAMVVAFSIGARLVIVHIERRFE